MSVTSQEVQIPERSRAAPPSPLGGTEARRHQPILAHSRPIYRPPARAEATAVVGAAYIARHRVNENHGDPLTPGALSRWLLWGESRSLARNTAAFRRRFRLQ